MQLVSLRVAGQVLPERGCEQQHGKDTGKLLFGGCFFLRASQDTRTLLGHTHGQQA
jgi:hypothetical protein